MQKDDQVQAPKHYDVWPDLAAIEVMACTSTLAEFEGFCRNTALKYTLRAGKKGVGSTEQDFAKRDQYRVLFEQYKHMCKDPLINGYADELVSGFTFEKETL